MPSAKLFSQDILLVLAGGALGSTLRYYVSILTNYNTRSPFPYKTLLVNILGCFLAGFIAIYFEHHSRHDHLRLFLIIGFIGAFTTFSTFSLETLMLYQEGHLKTALLNIAVSTVACLVSVTAGFLAGSAVK